MKHKLIQIIPIFLAFLLGLWSNPYIFNTRNHDCGKNSAPTTKNKLKEKQTVDLDKTNLSNNNVASINSCANDHENKYTQNLNTKTLLSNFIFDLFINFDEDKFKTMLANNTPFTFKEINRLQNPSQFAAKLADISFNNYYEEQYYLSPNEYAEINFLEKAQYTQDVDKHEFMADDKRIYTHFTVDNYTHNFVLIKWYNADTGEIMLFDKKPIKPHDQNHYIWLETNDRWQPGNYNVEIFSADEELGLLTAGQYRIESNT